MDFFDLRVHPFGGSCRRRTMRFASLVLAAAVIAAPAMAADGGPFTVKETGKSYSHLQQAVSAIGNGDGEIVIAPGNYRQCAVQEGGRVAYLASQPGTVVFDGAACEGKAT